MSDVGLFDELLSRAEDIVAGAPDRDAALQAVCDLLAGRVDHYDWVGFYLADGESETLVLGPFVGAPTEHVRIPFGEGICGQAAARRETLVVPDVSAEANYLACSLAVRSEIVVPVMRGGRFVAEIDIDSHTLSAFADADRALLEGVAEAVSELF
jgi:L-methionine (R)-S-oxide reductase